MYLWQVNDIKSRLENINNAFNSLKNSYNLTVEKINEYLSKIVQNASKDYSTSIDPNKTYLFDINKYLVPLWYAALKVSSYLDGLYMVRLVNGLTTKDSEENHYFVLKIDNGIEKLYTPLSQKDWLIKQLEKDISNLEKTYKENK